MLPTCRGTPCGGWLSKNSSTGTSTARRKSWLSSCGGRRQWSPFGRSSRKPVWTPPCCEGLPLQLQAQVANHLDYRRPGECRTLARVFPTEARGVHGDEVPHVFIHVKENLCAGLRSEARRTSHVRRDLMPLVPKL